jgi:hypothetical protein
MPNVLMSNDDITVLGPPEIIELLVDVGPAGVRGSQTFVGIGNPNTTNIGQTPIENDLYINAGPGADYSYLYQYVSQPGGLTWVKVLKMNPVLYNSLQTTTYTSGSASITIPLSIIIENPGAGITANNFSVQYSIVNENPVASSISSTSVVGTDFIINFKAVESSSGTWANLSGEVTTHLFISIVS